MLCILLASRKANIETMTWTGCFEYSCRSEWLNARTPLPWRGKLGVSVRVLSKTVQECQHIEATNSQISHPDQVWAPATALVWPYHHHPSLAHYQNKIILKSK